MAGVLSVTPYPTTVTLTLINLRRTLQLSKLIQKERAGGTGSFLFLKNGKLAFAAQGNQTGKTTHDKKCDR